MLMMKDMMLELEAGEAGEDFNDETSYYGYYETKYQEGYEEGYNEGKSNYDKKKENSEEEDE
jgi:flagellar biosynthesis/type III secretory pathway protein FliH